ncbi:vWA domain-containing protein [Nocardiopsis trehalosi]|uniref:vWA domain-containing protein n=1 Tax=Nocardiopsis trehalosi TaxID=109329 RepID=UPI000834B292|nr:vWA domain-containing protein [Nocardiopsis trehalosi]
MSGSGGQDGREGAAGEPRAGGRAEPGRWRSLIVRVGEVGGFLAVVGPLAGWLLDYAGVAPFDLPPAARRLFDAACFAAVVAALLYAAVGLLRGVPPDPPDPDPPPPAPQDPRPGVRTVPTPGPLRRALWACAATAAVLVVGAALAVALDTSGDACPPPEELIIATTPAGERTAAAAAAAFADEQADGHDCRPLAATVYAIDRAEDARTGLTDGWRPTDGPLPHVWLPDSSAEVARVADRLAERTDPEVTVTPALGGDGEPLPTRLTPLIAAVPRERAEAAAGDAGTAAAVTDDLYAALAATAPPGTPPAVRADPAGSATALLHTAAYYRSRDALDVDGGLTDRDAAAAVENTLRAGLTADDETAMLCAAADTSAGGGPAVLTTEAALYRVRAGVLCADGVSEAERADLVPLYPGEPLYLDHPFVRVEPRGLDDGADDAAAAFQEFLTGLYDDTAAFAPAPVGPGAGDAPATDGLHLGHRGGPDIAGAPTGGPYAPPGEIAWTEPSDWHQAAGTVLDTYRGLHDDATVLLALDVSSSMTAPSGVLATARREATALAELAGGGDTLGLWTFPGGPAPAAVDHDTPVHPADADDVRRRLHTEVERLDALYASTPLLDVIGDGVLVLQDHAAGDRTTDPVLVVVTDGVVIPDHPGIDLAEVERRLDGSGVRVRVLAVGADPDPCGTGPLPDLAALPGVDCVPVGADPERPGEAGRDALLSARTD